MSEKKTVVTGLGVMAPNGIGADAYWKSTVSGVSAIRPVSRFDASAYPVSLAAEIPEFPAENSFQRRLMPQTDRMTRLSLFAADYALADAGIDPAAVEDYAMGVAVTSSTGGLEFGQRELQQLWGSGWESVSPYMSFAWYYAVNTGQISIRHGMRGPGAVVISEQAGGIDSLAFARRRIRTGTAVMTAGGLDSMVCPYGMATIAMATGVSTCADPATAYLPFADNSSGFVPGEGGAVLILESAADAARRGAPQVYGAIAGYGAAFDPDPVGSQGHGLVRAARKALADAQLAADDIDVVFADAFGAVAFDRAEAAALQSLFARRVPVSAPKAMIGRLLCGAGPLDVAAALLCMRDGVIPAVPNVDANRVDPRIDLVIREPRSTAVSSVLVLSRGHGGFASAMVLTRS